MNVTEFLNRNAYPAAGQNARGKYLNKGSNITIAAATQEYTFFTTPQGNLFTSNMTLPFSGDQVFFMDKLALYINSDDSLITGALFNQLMQSFLEISVNDRVLYKTSVASVINFGWRNLGVTAAQIQFNGLFQNTKQFINPIIINSTSNVKFRLHLNVTAATSFDTLLLKCVIGGFQFDKLQQFEYNELMGNQFQRIDYDMYDIQSVVVAANTYNFFANANKSEELFSKVLPLSEQETFQIESIQVLFSDLNTVAPTTSLWFSRLQDRLAININDTVYYDSYTNWALSYYGSYITAAENDRLVRQSFDLLKTPILIPANSKDLVTYTQPATAVPIADQLIMLRFQGELSRRVA